MSFIGDLFGGKSSTPAAQPTPAPATPTINDAASFSAGREASARLARRMGSDKTILTSGLGDTGTGSISRTTALGGNSSLTA